MASYEFASTASGNVITLSAFANKDRVFIATELGALLENPDVTSIDGLPVSVLRDKVDALTDQFLSDGHDAATARRLAVEGASDIVTTRSANLINEFVQFEVDTDGKTTGVKVHEDFFRNSGNPNWYGIVDTSTGTGNFIDLNTANPTTWGTNFIKFMESGDN